MKYFFIVLLNIIFFINGTISASENVHVGRYESIPWGFNTNTWWVEGPSGVVLINTQFLPSATKEAVEIAESYTGKKVVLAFVLHANPDKFNGTGYLTKKGIKVVSSEQVINRIPEVDELRRGWFYERYKPDYPEVLTLPKSLGNKNTTIKAAGLQFNVHILGSSVSKDHIGVQVEEHLFVGDILANKHHSWLELGLIDEWLNTLNYIREIKPKYLYPGRGYASGINLVFEQGNYLNHFKKTVKKTKQQGEFNEARKELIVKELKELYPNYDNSFFLNLGVEPVWENLK